jgi:hypothetical protein
VAYDGFEPYAHTGVVLAIGQTAGLDVVMRPAGVVESVAVSAQPPPLDPRQTSVTTTIDTERIEELPVRSRNFLEFVLLAPGVTRPTRQTTAGAIASTLPDSGFSFGGLRPRSNTLTIDGLDNNDEFTGSTRTELSLEFIREFQVVSNGWSVENAGASGGGINVVTKSGANTLHGDAFLFGQFAFSMRPPSSKRRSGTHPRRGGIVLGWPSEVHWSKTVRSITRPPNANGRATRPPRISTLPLPQPSTHDSLPACCPRSTRDS